MIAPNRSGQDPGNTSVEDVHLLGHTAGGAGQQAPGQWQHEGHQDAHGAPARAGGERDDAAEQEGHGRQQEQRQPVAADADDVLGRVQALNNIGERPGQGEDNNGDQCGADALEPGIDGLMQREFPQCNGDCHGASNAQQGGPHQGQETVRTAQYFLN